MVDNKVCTSCKTSLMNKQGAVSFKCPGCSKFEIVRCAHCRRTVAKYICPECSFTGPN